MAGLPSELYQRCREILLKCSQLDNDPSLRALFATDELGPFRDGLPGALAKSARVDTVLDYLLPKQLSDGRPALPLLLEALRDRHQTGDALRDELDQLASEVWASLAEPVSPMPTPTFQPVLKPAITSQPPAAPPAEDAGRTEIPAPSRRVVIAGRVMLVLLCIDLILSLILLWRFVSDRPDILSYIEAVTGLLGLILQVVLLFVALRVREMSWNDVLTSLGTHQWLQVGVTAMTLILVGVVAVAAWLPGSTKLVVAMKTHHGRYVTAMNDEESRDWEIRAETSTLGNWERFTLLCLDDGKAAFQTYHGRYVTAMNDEESRDWQLRAETTTLSDWETFTLINPETEEKLHCSEVIQSLRQGGMRIALMTHYGRYVAAMNNEDNRDWVLRAETTTLGAWEKFVIEPLTSPPIPTSQPTLTNTVAPLPTSTLMPTLTPTPTPRTISPSNVDQVALVRVLKGHDNRETRVAFSPIDASLASGSVTGTVRLWNAVTWEELEDIPISKVYGVAFSPTGDTLALALADHTVSLWDIASRQELLVLEGHTGPVVSVAFSPDGSLLASGSDDKTVRVWKTSDGTSLYTLGGHGNQVNGVAFSPDGKFIASGSDDKTVRLWDMETGQEVSKLEGHADHVWGAAFSTNNALLASASNDDTVRLWDTRTGQEIRKLEGHTDDVTSVTFSPDGILLASGSWDGTVRLWRISDGASLRILKGNDSAVLSVAFSNGGRFLASGSLDGAVRLWGLEEGMTYIPAGTFWRGSAEGSPPLEGDETPQREINLDAFWIQTTEVTNAQYKRFVDAGGYDEPLYWSKDGWAWQQGANPDDESWGRLLRTWPRDWQDGLYPADRADHPVVAVNWYEADAYCRWLTEETGHSYRLPTEAEWEKAARGIDGRIYPWGNEWDPARANCASGGPSQMVSVGQYSPGGDSPYGVTDMAGNAYEWVADWYNGGYYGKSPDTNPLGPESSMGGLWPNHRVMRGGSWKATSEFVRTAQRHSMGASYVSDDVGFRCAYSEP